MTRWNFDSIPDQTGRTALVTGANTGIGFETALALARKEAHVVLACRNLEKGQQARDRLRELFPGASVALEQLDLSDLDNVRTFATRLRETLQRLDLLILNAGVMIPPASKTVQGFDLQFGVNHLGHFALTGALLPLVQATEGARVVVVSSTAARRGIMNFEDLQFEKRGYSPWLAYGQSKLANQLFTLELQRRLLAAGSTTLVTAAHPGWTATDLQRNSRLMQLLGKVFAMPPSQGVLPTLRAATDPAAAGGDYYGPDGFLQMRGFPCKIPMLPRAHITADAVRLWDISEELTGIRYELPSSPLNGTGP